MNNFKLIFTIRFFGYLLFISGLFGLFFIFGPIIQAEFNYRADLLLGVKHIIPNIVTSQTKNDLAETLDESGSEPDFSDISIKGDNIVPVSTEYGIVIEKINANAKVVPGIDASNEKEYTRALSEGVVEALGSTPPGKSGNLYLFAHSTNAPWNIVRYNAIFYLLRELEPGERVIIFYKNRRYDYLVFDKTVTAANDISFLTNKYEEPVLTLQTCDPPGTLLNRLIVRAKLINSKVD